MNKEEYDKVNKRMVELRDKEQQLVIANMPKFERGVTEASVEREQKIWEDIKKVLISHGLSPSVNVKLISETQPSDDLYRPTLVCPGVKVNIEYIVNPIDSKGKDGSMPEDVIDELAKIMQERAELERRLENGIQ